MERRPRTSYSGTRYPSRAAHPSRRSVLAGLGGAVGALAISAVTRGCLPPGNDDDTEGEAYDFRLPPAESRTVYINYGSIDFHVELGVDSSALLDYLQQEAGPLTDAVGEMLAGYGIYAFAPAETLTAIETAIAQLIADAFTGNEGSSLEDFVFVFLSIDHYDEGEEIAGMEG